MLRLDDMVRIGWIVAFATVGVTPVTAGAQASAVAAAPATVVPTLTTIRFFESGPATPEAAQRKYTESFETARARFIGVELTFSVEPGRTPAFDVACTYFTPQDSVFGRIEIPFTLEQDWNSVRNARILGFETPGRWAVGTYRVSCETGGANVAESRFEVVSGPADIASIQAKVAGMRFFASGANTPPADQRVYATRFVSTETSYLNVEISLVHEPIESTAEVPIACLVIAPDASIRASFAVTFAFQAGWRSTLSSNGWGRAEPGWWAAGTYRVACTAEGRLVAEDTFEVT